MPVSMRWRVAEEGSNADYNPYAPYSAADWQLEVLVLAGSSWQNTHLYSNYQLLETPVTAWARFLVAPPVSIAWARGHPWVAKRQDSQLAMALIRSTLERHCACQSALLDSNH